jgi:hypothetical protein
MILVLLKYILFQYLDVTHMRLMYEEKLYLFLIIDACTALYNNNK